MTGAIRLRHGDSTAIVSRRGAEATAWQCRERPMLWGGDARFWPRSAPVLFPFCGWLRGGQFRHAGRTYASPVHGFAPDAEFQIESREEDAVRLVLRDSVDTRARFPFAFALHVEVRLDADSLIYRFAVENSGDAPLPYALGFHPGFLWPFDGGLREDYRIHFSQDETARAQKIAPGGLFAGETVPIPLSGRILDIASALARQDSLVLLHAASQNLAFVAPSGTRLEIAAAGFPHWVFWSLPGSGYLCIEGWTGQGDPVDFAGDLLEKPGMLLLAPGARRAHAFSMRFSASAI